MPLYQIYHYGDDGDIPESARCDLCRFWGVPDRFSKMKGIDGKPHPYSDGKAICGNPGDSPWTVRDIHSLPWWTSPDGACRNFAPKSAAATPALQAAE